MPSHRKSFQIIFFTFLGLLLLAPPPVFSQKRQKMELLQADRATSFTRNGLTYRRLVGNVKLRRNDAILSCDLAELQVERDEALLQGNVSIATETSTLTGRSATYQGRLEYVEIKGSARFEDPPFFVQAEKLGYFIDLKKVVATGQPSLLDSASILSADTIYYYEDTQLGDARGKALMINNSDSLSVAGDQLLYFSGKDSLLSYGHAEFKKWSPQDTSLNIRSDSLSLEEGYFFAWKNVKLRNGTAEGRCGQAVYIQDEDMAIMKDHPVLREDDFKLTGEIFNLNMKNGELTSVYVPEKPHFIQYKALGDTTYEDWLDGQIMAVEFDQGQPSTVTLIKMATSFFNVIEDRKFKGSNKVSGDTLFILLSDSSISDITVSRGAEGTFEPNPQNNDIGFPIKYKASRISYNMADETTQLRGGASIKYGDMALEAGKIGVFWRQNLLRAGSLIDSLGANDFPVLKQTGQDDFHGKTMLYDLKTRRGKVAAGRTTLDDGNYYGEELTRINEDVYLMQDGYYTTCSLEEDPHFYFYSKQMKLISDRIIIAKPVVLYIADVPLAALPFAVFPQKKGRKSGFILPSYDYRPGTWGRALKGYGYYWAINDYSDFKMTGDFYDKYEEFKINSTLRYKKRYRISGNIKLEMESIRTALNDPASWDWALKFTHSQTIDPTFTIKADGKISGNADFYRTYSQDQNERLDTKLHSGISINKRFESLNTSASLSGTYDENLQVTRRVEATPESAGIKLSGPALALPSFSINKSSAALFPQIGNESHWYNTLRWNYGNTFKNRRNWSYLSYINPDTTSGDSLLWEEEIVDKRTWNHNMGLSANTQLFKVLKITGTFSYLDAWGFKYQQPLLDASGNAFIDTSSGALITQEVDGFIRRGTFSTGFSVNTKLYGIFPVHIGALQAVRHTLTPSVSMSYAPDFSSDFWGYTKSITDTTGAVRTFDRFAGSDLGATSTREALSLSYTIDNVFDYKLLQEEKETKSQFFSWKLSGSYNFKADSLKASDIKNTFNISLGKSFKLTPQATFEIYERDSTGTRKINQYRAPRMTNAGFSFGFRLQGRSPGGLRSQPAPSIPEDSLVTELEFGEDLSDEAPLPPAASKGSTVWSANFTFSYSYTHINPLEDPKQTFNLRSSLKFNFGKNWAITYSPSFDLIERKINPFAVGVSRDLHCWNMSLSWTPMGRYGGVNLVIKPKASQLQDLKLEHTSNRRF
jgi:lipopolysaccharide assembly outer membrane protein LptD (OstA)